MPEAVRITVAGENVTLPETLPFSQPGELYKISVSDQGTGITADALDKIFDAYFTKTKSYDSGLPRS